MAENYYDEIEFEDMTFHPDMGTYTYPCPCGDNFQISLEDMRDGEDVGVCPSCSLMIKVIFDIVSYALGGQAKAGLIMNRTTFRHQNRLLQHSLLLQLLERSRSIGNIRKHTK